jgi:hypothetical protein
VIVLRDGMKKAIGRSEIQCDVDTFWKVFLDKEYNRAFYLEELGFPRLEILEQTETTRRLRAVPKMDMPGPVKKILGDSFGYEEVGSLDRQKNEWRWKMVPNTMPDKLKTDGVVRVEPAGEGKCRRVDEVNIEAKIFGIGGLIESSAEKEIKAAWDKEAAFMNRWIKAHPIG